MENAGTSFFEEGLDSFDYDTIQSYLCTPSSSQAALAMDEFGHGSLDYDAFDSFGDHRFSGPFLNLSPPHPTEPIHTQNINHPIATSSSATQSTLFPSPPPQTEPSQSTDNTGGINPSTNTSSSAAQSSRSCSPSLQTEYNEGRVMTLEENRILNLLLGLVDTFSLADPELDPWDFNLPREHLTSLTKRETHRGIWNERKGGLKAFRQNKESQFVLAMRAWDFQQKSFTKDKLRLNWVMQEYCLLQSTGCKNELFLAEDIVFRKVFQKQEKDVVNGSNSSQDNCLPNKKATLGKRSRSGAPSDVWNNGMIRIRTKDPEVSYAVCVRCEQGFKASSGNGTTTLQHHQNKYCPFKDSQPSTSVAH